MNKFRRIYESNNIHRMMSSYSMFDYPRIIFWLITTKLISINARLIRRPFYCRGRKFIHFGNGFTSGVGCRIEAFPEKNHSGKCIKFGNNVQINDYVHIAAHNSILIGNNVLMASKIFITDLNHGFYGSDNKNDYPDSIPKDRALSSLPVIIEDNVWIGESVTVLQGVVIGFGSIIGANSVVTKDTPKHSIAVGIPARVIKKFIDTNNRWEKVL